MKTNMSPSAGQTTASGLQDVYEGGFGVQGAGNIRAALNATPYSLLNQNGGIAGLNSQVKFDPNRLYTENIGTVSLDGPTKVVKGTSVQYQITNFDSFTDYSLSCNLGQVDLIDNQVIYTAPVNTGTIALTINQKTYNIAIVDFKPTTPTVNGTHTPGVGENVTGSFLSSAFAIVGTTDVHDSSDWQIATDSNFTTIIDSVQEDRVALLSWSTASLQKATQYFVRVRHRTVSGLVSDWSNAFVFTTKTVYYPNVEQAKLVASDRIASDYFGTAVAISDDGLRVAIGAYGQDGGVSNSGAAYIFRKEGTSWIQEARLQATSRVSGDQLGWSIALDANASRVVVGAPLANNNSLSDNGAAYVFRRTDTTWIQEALIVAPAATRTGNARFGQSVDIDSTGTRIIVGATQADQSGASNCGMAYIFTRSGTTWGHESTLIASDRAGNDNAGNDVAIDSTGTRACFGSHNDDNGSPTNTGSVYVFLRSGTTWSQEAKLLASDRLSGDCLGYAVDMDSTGTRIVAGAYNDDDSGLTNSGAVYIFVRSGTSWSQEAKLLASDKISSAWFGAAVSINGDGSRVLISAFSMTINGMAGAGQAYTFSRNNTSWTQDGTIRPSDLMNDDNFAYDLDIDPSGYNIIVGAAYDDVSGVMNTGSAYIFTS